MLFILLIFLPLFSIIFVSFFSSFIFKFKKRIFGFGLLASLLQYFDTFLVWVIHYKKFFVSEIFKIDYNEVFLGRQPWLNSEEDLRLYLGLNFFDTFANFFEPWDFIVDNFHDNLPLQEAVINNFEDLEDFFNFVIYVFNSTEFTRAVLTVFNSSLFPAFFLNNTIEISLASFGFQNIFPGFSYTLFFDSLSFVFILLTNFIIPITLLSQIFFYHYNFRNGLFLSNIFFIQFLLINCFLVVDLLVFFILFELIIIPVYLLIGIFGSRLRKIKANNYFFLYTLMTSNFLLLALILIYIETGSFNYFNILGYEFDFKVECFLWICFFITFATKVPIFPFHLWLPEAHVEAPTSVSIILASLLLKLGGYGLIRFVIPLFPTASYYFWPLVCFLTLSSVTFGTFSAISQIDIKKIIAYSSIVHMNLAVLGIFSLNIYGYIGGILLMLSHGITSAGLFFLVGVIYERYHTRVVSYYGGLASSMPLFSIFLFLFLITNIGFPGSFNFIAEFLLFLSISNKSLILLYLLFPGFLFSVMYSFWLFSRICFGELKINKKNFIDGLNEKNLLFISLIEKAELFFFKEYINEKLKNYFWFSFFSDLIEAAFFIDAFIETKDDADFEFSDWKADIECYFTIIYVWELDFEAAVLVDFFKYYDNFLNFISVLFLEFNNLFKQLNSVFLDINFLKFNDYLTKNKKKTFSKNDFKSIYANSLFFIESNDFWKIHKNKLKSTYTNSLFIPFMKDLTSREFYVLLSLFILTILFGIFPQGIINLFI